MQRPNFIFGKGENLARTMDRAGGGGGQSSHWYTMKDAQRVIRPKVLDVANALKALPPAACPNDEAVVCLILHPKYISKTWFPESLLASTGLRLVGSKETLVVPRKGSTDGRPETTTELYIAGPRSAFDRLARLDRLWQDWSSISDDIIKVEDWVQLTPGRKVSPFDRTRPTVLFEVILHADASEAGDLIRVAFKDYLDSFDKTVDLAAGFRVGGLTFLPVSGSPNDAERVALFNFVRRVREMPSLRVLSTGSVAQPAPFPVVLPVADAVDQTVVVGIYDGGMPPVPGYDRWVSRYDAEGIGPPLPSQLEHGFQVTAANLFGPLGPSAPVERPFARVDHWRVEDTESARDPKAMYYPVLKRIETIQLIRRYPLFLCCLGPDEAVQDDDVNLWTVLLDSIQEETASLAITASGNNGERDPELGYNRIQPPGDTRNGFSIGACERTPLFWSRPAFGPVGLCGTTGMVKFDAAIFCGTPDDPFWVPDRTDSGKSKPSFGTSLGAAYALRMAAGTRAVLGPDITPIVSKAMLTHTVQDGDHLEMRYRGWGRVNTNLGDVITCATCQWTTVYTGTLGPKKLLRAEIPVPKDATGNVVVTATVCYRTKVEAHNPVTYTKAGVVPHFRPDFEAVPDGKSQPETLPMFGVTGGLTEAELRRDARKWSTTIRARKAVSGELFKNPAIDLHYVPREDGHDAHDAGPIEYAMIVTVYASRFPAGYNEVFKKYRGQLLPLKPVVEINITF